MECRVAPCSATPSALVATADLWLGEGARTGAYRVRTVEEEEAIFLRNRIVTDATLLAAEARAARRKKPHRSLPVAVRIGRGCSVARSQARIAANTTAPRQIAEYR